MSSPEVLDFAPERLVDPVPRRALGARVVAYAGLGLVSLALNVAVVAWLARIGWPLRPTEAASPVSVEIVDHMPGEGKAGGGAPQKTAQADGPAPEPAKRAEAPAAAPPPEAPKAPEPPKPSDPLRMPEPTPEVQAETQPEPPAQPAPAQEGARADAKPVAKPSPDAPPAAEAVPPPPEHPDNTARPQLVEAPKAPAPSATQQTEPLTPPEPAPVPPEKVEPQPVAAPAPVQPPVLSSPNADEAIAPAAPPPEKPPEPTAEQKRQAEMTARLAAALPFGSPAGLDPFQTATQGQTASQNYRGAVYANFAKADSLIKDACAKHLRGQAVVAFSVDNKGELARLAIGVSSGNAEVDATALEMIRRAAPFPPPPPGAQRSFSPALNFCLDE